MLPVVFPQLSVLEVSPLEKELKKTHLCSGKKASNLASGRGCRESYEHMRFNPSNPIAVATSLSDSPRF